MNEEACAATKARPQLSQRSFLPEPDYAIIKWWRSRQNTDLPVHFGNADRWKAINGACWKSSFIRQKVIEAKKLEFALFLRFSFRLCFVSRGSFTSFWSDHSSHCRRNSLQQFGTLCRAAYLFRAAVSRLISSREDSPKYLGNQWRLISCSLHFPAMLR